MVAEWDIVFPFNLASSISSLACWMASQRCFMRSSCTASQASFWMWKRSMTRSALGNAVRTIFRMESDKSRVISSTARRFSSSIRRSASITSSDFVPATTAIRDFSLVRASRLVTNVYSSPLDSEDSSMAILVPMLSGNSSHLSACSS